MLRAVLAVAVSTTFLVALAGPLEADSITQSDFGPGASVESFEGLVSQNPTTLGVPTLLPSGVTVDVSTGVVGALLDTAIGPTGAYGSIITGSDVPDGTAFLVRNTFSTSRIAFEFSSDQLRVGFFAAFTSTFTGDVILAAYDSDGDLLETLATPAVNIPDWGDAFIGIENAAGIRSIEVYSESSVGLVLDALTFEAVQVPEPGTLGLFALGGLLLAAQARRRAQHRARG